MSDTDNTPVNPIDSAAGAPTTAPAAPSSVESPAQASTPTNTSAPVEPQNSEAPDSSPGVLSAEPSKGDAPVDAPADVKLDDAKPSEDAVAPKDAPQEISSEDKKEDPKPEVEAKPELVESPSYEAFKFPEGFTPDEKAVGEFTGLLGELEKAKGDHKSVQETGQKLVDMFSAKMVDAQKKLEEYYVTLHNQDKQKMLDELKADPYFGGNGDAAKQAKAQMDMHIFLQRNLSKDELKSFSQFVKDRGIDNALPLARVINTLKQKIDRYEKESATSIPGTKPESSAPSHPGRGMMQKMYGKK